MVWVWSKLPEMLNFVGAVLLAISIGKNPVHVITPGLTLLVLTFKEPLSPLPLNHSTTAPHEVNYIVHNDKQRRGLLLLSCEVIVKWNRQSRGITGE
jgi:hypothetical protein